MQLRPFEGSLVATAARRRFGAKGHCGGGSTDSEGTPKCAAKPDKQLADADETDWKTGPVEPARYTDRGQCHLYAVMLIPGVPQKGTHRRSSSSQLHKVWRPGLAGVTHSVVSRLCNC